MLKCTAVISAFEKTVKFLGKESILRPLVFRQHALVYNRVIALGTDGAKKTHSVFYNSTLTYLGLVKRKET